MPKEKKVTRSKEMVLLAYFMEKYGDRTASFPTAPSELINLLGKRTFKDVFKATFARLGDTRSEGKYIESMEGQVSGIRKLLNGTKKFSATIKECRIIDSYWNKPEPANRNALWADVRSFLASTTENKSFAPPKKRRIPSLIQITSAELREVEELEDHFASKKVRKYQGIFRENAIRNFDGRCCISGMLDKKLLVASHIVPWAEDKTIRLDPSNGLLLYAEYDRLFDQYYFTVEDDLRIRVVPWFKECGKPVRDTLGRIDGRIIRDGILKPINREYLKRHRDKFTGHTAPSTRPEELS